MFKVLEVNKGHSLSLTTQLSHQYIYTWEKLVQSHELVKCTENLQQDALTKEAYVNTYYISVLLL